MLDDFVFFITLYELQSFKKCAESLKISLPTLSRHISELELKLGKKLIIRDSKKFEPTNFGTYMYNQIKYIPSFVDNVINIYNKIDNKTHYQGTLNVALGDSIAYDTINPHLNEFLLEHPGIKLNITYLPNITAWPNQNIDIVLSVGYINGSDLENRFLRKEYIKLYCRSNYALKFGIPQEVDELNQHSVIGPVNDSYIAHNYLKLENIYTRDEYLLDLTSNRLNLNSSFHSRKIGLNSDIIFGSIEPIVQDDLAHGIVLPVLPAWAVYRLDFYLVTKKIITEKEQLFIDFIYKCMRL